MSNVPEGAQRSDDGHYWWDGQQWQPVDENAVVSDAANAGGDAAESGVDDRSAARIAEGLPASLYDLTPEHRDQYLDEPTIVHEPVEHEEVEVLAMQDAGGESGEGLA